MDKSDEQVRATLRHARAIGLLPKIERPDRPKPCILTADQRGAILDDWAGAVLSVEEIAQKHGIAGAKAGTRQMRVQRVIARGLRESDPRAILPEERSRLQAERAQPPQPEMPPPERLAEALRIITGPCVEVWTGEGKRRRVNKISLAAGIYT